MKTDIFIPFWQREYTVGILRLPLLLTAYEDEKVVSKVIYQEDT